MIEFSCQSCGAKYKVGDDKAGKRGKCAKCGETLHIPPLPRPVQQQEPATPPQPAAVPAPPAVEQAAEPVSAMDALASAMSGSATNAAPKNNATQPQEQPAPSDPPQASAAAIPVARPSGGGKKLWLAIAGGVIVLAAAGVLSYIFLFNGTEQTGGLDELKALAKEANELNSNAYDRSENIYDLKMEDLLKAKDALTEAIAKYDELFAAAEKLAGKNPEAGKIVEGTRYKYSIAKSQLAALDDSIWPGPGEYRDMYMRVGPSVPMIVLAGGSGSGFLFKHIDKLYIVTNRHVIAGAEDKLELNFYMNDDPDDEPIKITLPPSAITHIHRGADLALVDVTDKKDKLASNGIRPLRMAARERAPAKADPIWVVGHPSAGELGILKREFRAGYVAEIVDNYLGYNSCLIEIDAAINPGNSGGPVLNKRGQVVAVVSFFKIKSASGAPMDRQNFGVHIDWLYHLLSNNKYNLSKEEIARVVSPKATLSEELKKITEELAAKGYKPAILDENKTSRFITLRQGQAAAILFDATAGKEYIAVAVSAETNDGQLRIIAKGDSSDNIKPLTYATKSNTTSVVAEFEAESTGKHGLTYATMGRHVQPVIIALFKK